MDTCVIFTNIKLIKITGKKKTVTAQFGNLKYSDGFDCVLKNADSGENIVLKNLFNTLPGAATMKSNEECSGQHKSNA